MLRLRTGNAFLKFVGAHLDKGAGTTLLDVGGTIERRRMV